jgi:hypothetical protein
MTNQPNIFNYATSELTQDAFITWLLHWANPKHKTDNEALQSLGSSFLASLLASQDIKINGDITNFHIKQQFHKIDVFVTFKIQDTSYGIIIEDKVHTTDHNNQLEIYKNKIVDKKICDVLVLIYFKTGYQVNLSRIKENGYHYYSIKDFLKLIPQEKIAQINNDVLSQYYTYLLKKEIDFDYADTQANNYLTKPLKDWTWWTCVRFFHEYKQHFNAGWKSVANNREPLLAFWFGGRFITVNDVHNNPIKLEIYIDIVYVNDNLKVNYRLSLHGNEQKNDLIRNEILEEFIPFLIKNDIEFKKAKFKKAKETMLLFQIVNLDKNIKYEAFVDQIETYHKVLCEFVENKL